MDDVAALMMQETVSELRILANVQSDMSLVNSPCNTNCICEGAMPLRILVRYDRET